MSTSAPEKTAGPALSRVPPDESSWKRYSPHGEAPLSLAGSIALHTLGLGGALLLIIYIASVLSNTKESLPVEPVRLALGGGGGSKGGSGDGKGVGKAPEENLGQEDPDPQPGEVDAPKQPALNKVELKQVEQKFDPVSQRFFEATTSVQARRFAQLDDKLRNKLSDGLNPGKGGGGTGSGGGKGAGTGSGDGDAAGPGKATLNQRERRMLRWHMKFEARNGPEYLAQLRGLGAILAFPVNEGAEPTYKVVHNLTPGRAKLESEDLSKIHKIYWIDDKPRSVQDILAALGLGIRPTPSKFVAFMPQKLEDDLFAQERRYVENVLRRPFQEDKIEETIFRAVPAGRGFKAELISVAMKP
jgi:hypothetical protein